MAEDYTGIFSSEQVNGELGGSATYIPLQLGQGYPAIPGMGSAPNDSNPSGFDSGLKEPPSPDNTVAPSAAGSLESQGLA